MDYSLPIDELKKKSQKIRVNIIKMITEAGSGHPAGSLGIVDILVALYFSLLNHDPKNHQKPDRDHLILSNGHVCPALYAVLSEAGYFSEEELLTLRKLNSRLQGHPHRQSLPGLETTSGPLGEGLSQACGMALGAKIDGAKWRTVCIMSDAEQEEGNVWEAVLFAVKYRLDNLVAFIDQNNIQIDGFTNDVMPLGSLKEKYQAFGWNVLEIDGHNFEQIIDSFSRTKEITRKPTVIIANTTPGKGVSFMEDNPQWHGKAPSKEEAERALTELQR